MGHLDMRISGDKDPVDGEPAGVKDGVSNQPAPTSPKKEDEAEASVEKSPDVLSSGDQPVSGKG